MARVYFREEQRFRQKWIWITLVLTFLVTIVPVWYGVYIQTVEGREWGNNPMETKSLLLFSILLTLFMGAFIALFVILKLETIVSSEGLQFRYFPFIRKWRIIKPADIVNFTTENYTPMATYGGWGIKQGGKGAGKAYTVSGKIGLKLTLADGRKILIGTQQKEALNHAMKRMMAKPLHTDPAY